MLLRYFQRNNNVPNRTVPPNEFKYLSRLKFNSNIIHNYCSERLRTIHETKIFLSEKSINVFFTSCLKLTLHTWPIYTFRIEPPFFFRTATFQLQPQHSSQLSVPPRESRTHYKDGVWPPRRYPSTRGTNIPNTHYNAKWGRSRYGRVTTPGGFLRKCYEKLISRRY